MKTCILFLFVTFLFLTCGFAGNVYASPFKGPWGEQSTKKTSNKQINTNFNPLRSLVEFYRNYMSPISSKRCPMYPSCSQYSLLCFEKHGLLMGWVMTCDRLLHEPDEMRKAPVVYINGQEKSYDPPENNDFWWHSEH